MCLALPLLLLLTLSPPHLPFSLRPEPSTSRAQIEAAFAVFDTDGDGTLSPAELKAILTRSDPGRPSLLTEAEVDELVERFDTNGDGVLSVEEFARAWGVTPLESSIPMEDAPLILGPASSLPPEIQVLSRLDDGLVQVLRRGDIRLLRVAWLMERPDGYIMERRQELEAREREGESPLLSTQEAAELVRRGDRSVGAFTYGWLSPGNPDPLGARLAVLRSALAQLPHIEGLFWDFASLYQALRTEAENEAFGRSLPAMNQLYASAVGTTVLQLKEIPPTPKEYLGALCLFGVADSISESAITTALHCFGKVVSCQLNGPLRLAQKAVLVHFSSHAEALRAKGSVSVDGLYAGADTLYNEHPYDKRGWVE